MTGLAGVHLSAGGPQAASADLRRVAAAFGLGAVTAGRFLADGLMNDNWRVETDTSVFLVKRIRDVSLPKARRNLQVLGELAAQGLPVPEPVHCEFSLYWFRGFSLDVSGACVSDLKRELSCCVKPSFGTVYIAQSVALGRDLQVVELGFLR